MRPHDPAHLARRRSPAASHASLLDLWPGATLVGVILAMIVLKLMDVGRLRERM